MRIEPGPSWCLLLTALLLAIPGCRSPEPSGADWRFADLSPPVKVRGGMVVSGDRYASEIGVAILERGGNAIDAAVATSFALAVTYPRAGNLGGGGFMVVRLADGTSTTLDYREEAPQAATRDMYLDDAGELTDRSVVGVLAAGVPGSVLGVWEAHRRFGTLPWPELVQPAVELAREFEVHESLHVSLSQFTDKIETVRGSYQDQLEATLETFFPGGGPPAVGARFQQPLLAETLTRIAAEGPDDFYRGRTADLIVASMNKNGGIITHEDLTRYNVEWREPITFDYRGYRVITMPPVSSGGVTLAEIANILEGYELDALPFDSPERVHLLAEAMRRAFADRNSYLGDPDFVRMPLAEMISDEHAANRRATIDPHAATPSDQVAPGLGPVHEGDETTHISIVDAEGNAVSLTTTINSSFGALVVVEGAGFLLNNEMDDFAARPGSPNLYGLVQGEANSIRPGARMLSSMTPAIVLDPDGKLYMLSGSPGGSRIISSVFQTLSNAIDHEMTASAIVSAPRMHHQHLPDQIRIEQDGFSDATLEALRAMGHRIELVETQGNVQVIRLLPDGTRSGASDPRRWGVAAGHGSVQHHP